MAEGDSTSAAPSGQPPLSAITPRPRPRKTPAKLTDAQWLVGRRLIEQTEFERAEVDALRERYNAATAAAVAARAAEPAQTYDFSPLSIALGSDIQPIPIPPSNIPSPEVECLSRAQENLIASLNPELFLAWHAAHDSLYGCETIGKHVGDASIEEDAEDFEDFADYEDPENYEAVAREIAKATRVGIKGHGQRHTGGDCAAGTNVIWGPRISEWKGDVKIPWAAGMWVRSSQWQDALDTELDPSIAPVPVLQPMERQAVGWAGEYPLRQALMWNGARGGVFKFPTTDTDHLKRRKDESFIASPQRRFASGGVEDVEPQATVNDLITGVLSDRYSTYHCCT